MSGAPVEAADLRGGAALVVAGLASRGATEVSGVRYIDRGYENLERSFCSAWREHSPRIRIKDCQKGSEVHGEGPSNVPAAPAEPSAAKRTVRLADGAWTGARAAAKPPGCGKDAPPGCTAGRTVRPPQARPHAPSPGGRPPRPPDRPPARRQPARCRRPPIDAAARRKRRRRFMAVFYLLLFLVVIGTALTLSLTVLSVWKRSR